MKPITQTFRKFHYTSDCKNDDKLFHSYVSTFISFLSKPNFFRIQFLFYLKVKSFLTVFTMNSTEHSRK